MTPGETAYTAFWQIHHRPYHDLPPFAQLPLLTRQAWEAATQAVRVDIHDALILAVHYGQIDGDHHKAWVIDQMCRMLLGTEDAYRQFVRDACTGEDGPQTYDWYEGIAP